MAVAVYDYPDGVIDSRLPGSGAALPPEWALQNPQNWLSTLEQIVPQVIREAGTDPADVIGMGVDFTSCTVLPTTAEGVPLCCLEKWSASPHAWPKLWTYHAALRQA